jgi:hypothetical protein
MISVQMTPASKAKLERLADEMQRTTGAEMKKVIRNVGRDLCYAALALTPAVKAKRGPVWLSYKKLHAWVPWHRTNAPGGIRRVDSGGGLTKAGWMAALAKLGAKVRKVPGGMVLAWGIERQSQSNGKAGLVCGNAAPWIEDFDKGRNPMRHPLHITERAAQQVAAKMDERLNKMAAAVARRWEGTR